MKKIGSKLKEEEIKEYFKKVDVDNSGFIDENEFVKLVLDHLKS